MQVAEIALTILLEVITVDHDGRGRLALPSVFLIGLIVGVGIFYNEHQSFAVGRPVKVRNATFDVCEFLRLSARAVKHPYLGSEFFLRLVSARRQEREVFVIGAPPWTTLAAIDH